MTKPLFEFKHVQVTYPVGSSEMIALHDISLTGYHNSTLGVVGESGCGKSTLAKALLQLVPLAKGSLFFEQQDLSLLSPSLLRQARKGFQTVFQDPDSSLNPRMTIAEHLKEALSVYHQKGEITDAQVEELLEKVFLSKEHMHRYPYELSGGQKQRASIARALAVKPKLIILDEPLSALDVSIRVQIIQLLLKLQHEEQLSYLFITHDLATLRYLAHRIAVFYCGHIVELGTQESIYECPQHPYTQTLLNAIPIPDPLQRKPLSRASAAAEMPSLLRPIEGCPFYNRCPRATDHCRRVKPSLEEKNEGHFVACHFPNSKKT